MLKKNGSEKTTTTTTTTTTLLLTQKRKVQGQNLVLFSYAVFRRRPGGEMFIFLLATKTEFTLKVYNL